MFAVFTAGFLAPHFSILNSKRKTKIKEKQKRWAAVRRRIINSSRDLRSASGRREIKAIAVEIVRLTVWPVLSFAIASSLSIALVFVAHNSTEESDANFKSAMRTYVEDFDVYSSSLWQSTSPTVEQVLFCDEVSNELKAEFNCENNVPRESRQRVAELRCNIKASLYEREKWYEGYSEYDRLSGTINAYKLCMLEDGWITTVCMEDERKEKSCTKINFRESLCLQETRKWLDDILDRQPCEEATNWWYSSRPEPRNRQW